MIVSRRPRGRAIRWLLAASLLAASLLATSAAAQTEAGALIDEGVKLREAGEEGNALSKFEAAYALAPTPRAAAQRGLAEKSLRRYVAAELHLNEALGAADDAWVKKNRGALEFALSLVVKHLAWLDVTCDVEGATLSINGTPVGSLPLAAPHRVLAGQVVIEVEAPGFLLTRITRALPAAQRTAVPVVLEPKPAPSPAKPAPETPAPKPKPATRQRAPAADPPPKPVEPSPEPASWTPWIVTAGATGAIALGVGIGLGVRTLDLKAERDALCPDAGCTSADGVALDDDARSAALGATVSFVVAGTATAATVILWLLAPSHDDDTAWVPRASPAGLQWQF